MKVEAGNPIGRFGGNYFTRSTEYGRESNIFWVDGTTAGVVERFSFVWLLSFFGRGLFGVGVCRWDSCVCVCKNRLEHRVPP